MDRNHTRNRYLAPNRALVHPPPRELDGQAYYRLLAPHAKSTVAATHGDLSSRLVVLRHRRYLGPFKEI
jgi:hypothetical protein